MDKTISAEMLTTIVNGLTEDNAFTDETWNGLEVRIKRTLSVSEMFSFVTGITDFCFLEEIGYSPELKDFGVRREVVRLYTNIELPDSALEAYRILYDTDLFEFVLKWVDQIQFRVILESVNETLDYRTKTDIGRISGQLNELSTVFNKFFGEMKDVDVNRLEEALISLQQLGEKAEEIKKTEE